mmetsp:Transcript_12206/g.25855  ORF Transcript_12206/g.25855 Transcript_12206/m.25855 type:complete len:112 (+) Transcript_12206:278-613(+)
MNRFVRNSNANELDCQCGNRTPPAIPLYLPVPASSVPCAVLGGKPGLGLEEPTTTFGKTRYVWFFSSTMSKQDTTTLATHINALLFLSGTYNSSYDYRKRLGCLAVGTSRG